MRSVRFAGRKGRRPPAKKKKQQKKRETAYQIRNRILREIGFDSYAEYLKHPIWKIIREKVMESCDGRCFCCGEIATQVHHSKYTRSNLTGKDLSGLLAVCSHCHVSAEFAIGGSKQPLQVANKQLGIHGKKAVQPSYRFYCLHCKKELLHGQKKFCSARCQSIKGQSKGKKKKYKRRKGLEERIKIEEKRKEPRKSDRNKTVVTTKRQ